MTESTRSPRNRSILFSLQDLSSLTLTNIRPTTTDPPSKTRDDASTRFFLEDMAARTLERATLPFDDDRLFEERAYPPSALLMDGDWPARPSPSLYILGLIVFFVLGAISALLVVALLL